MTTSPKSNNFKLNSQISKGNSPTKLNSENMQWIEIFFQLVTKA